MTAKHEELIRRLYAAFDRHDGAEMASLYAPDARFSDPVFGTLHGAEPGAMWQMLTARAPDLRVELEERDPTSAHWVATYTFSQTGRKVRNDVRAVFRFDDATGLIAEHDDRFSFHTWARQALGAPGLLLGWTPFLKAKVRGQARSGLAQHMAGSRP